MSPNASDLPDERFAPRHRADRLDHAVRDELEAILEARARAATPPAPRPAASARALLRRLSRGLASARRP